MVEELLQSLYRKLREDVVAEARNCLAKTGAKHRKRASNFFIDASDHLGGGDIIWDKRVYLEAKERGQAPPEGCITRLDVQQDIVPRINAKRFIERMDKSKNPDQYARQQLLCKGMMTHANQLRDTMIMVNHAGVANHVGFCDGILEKEEEDGIVSRGYQEIPLCPGKNHSRNVAPGPRMCVDMGQPRNEMDGGGSRSPNATANTGDHTKHRNLKLTTPMDFFSGWGSRGCQVGRSLLAVWITRGFTDSCDGPGVKGGSTPSAWGGGSGWILRCLLARRLGPMVAMSQWIPFWI
jgi:hypothetical protein